MRSELDPPVRPRPLDEEAMAAARERQRRLLKPPGSLGRLEELAVWLAGVSGEPLPDPRPAIVVAAADHGVAAEGVSAYPQAVTGQMLRAFLGGGSAVAALAAELRCPVWVVDAGVVAPPPEVGERLIRSGLPPARNLTCEPALSGEAVTAALALGRRLAARAAAEGHDVLVGGEMGIANTTPSTCLAAWLTGRDGDGLCGPGTGLDEDGLRRKRQAVATALRRHRPHVDGPLEALRRLGGGELAVLCGLALGAGECGLGYVCDGLIATAAAAVAVELAPALLPRLLAGHHSPEPAHAVLLERLGLEPLLDLRMRLGEASGAVTSLAVLRMASAAHRGMSTFAEAGVSGPRA